MIFAPRELCEKLQEMGCVSESGFSYCSNDSPVFEPILIQRRRNANSWTKAFYQNDFTGNTERARDNARIVWGIEEKHQYEWPSNYCKICGEDLEIHLTRSCSEYHRHAMIDYTEGPWFEYLEKFLINSKL